MLGDCGTNVPPPDTIDQETRELIGPDPYTVALAKVEVPPGTGCGFESSAPPEVARKASTEVTTGTTAELTVAVPETLGFATEVAVTEITPGPVAVIVGTPAVTSRDAGPETLQVTACDRVLGLTTALALNVPPGAIVVTLGVTVMLVIKGSGPSVTTNSANFVGSATEVARTVVLPVAGVAANVNDPEVVGLL